MLKSITSLNRCAVHMILSKFVLNNTNVAVTSIKNWTWKHFLTAWLRSNVMFFRSFW